MYTECPECQTNFRLTAQILRQAQGRVRCGGCGSTFNALDHLSEEPPAPDTSDTQLARRFEQESRELLESLDELSGAEDVRIEDTGSEWKVVDDEDQGERADVGDDDRAADAAADEPVAPPDGPAGFRFMLTEAAEGDENDAGVAEQPVGARPDDAEGSVAGETPQAALDPGAAGDNPDELRFDDNTPLPDDFYRALESPPRRRASDRSDDERSQSSMPPSEQTTHVDLELSDLDWQDLLAEVEAGGDGPATADAIDSAEDAVLPAAAGDVELVSADADDVAASSDAPPSAEASPVAFDADPAPESDMAQADPDVEQPEGAVAATSDAPGDDADDEAFESAAAALEGSGDDAGDDADAEALDIAALVADVELGESAGTPPEIDSDDESAEPAAALAERDPEEDEADDELPETTASLPVHDDDLTADIEIDQGLMQAAADGDIDAEGNGKAPWYEDPTLVETIVMEGDRFSDTLAAVDARGNEQAPDDESAPDEADGAEPELEDGQFGASTAQKAPAMTQRQRYLGIAAIVLLGLLLAAQIVHANRESLATLAVFDNTLAPLYAALGNPVTPAWDIRGWQFESTNGSTDETGSRLTIYSRVANRSEDALPYPLVHVSLTDRFDDVIGSRLLAPDEYLAGNARVSRKVAAGGDFTAVISVDAPSPDATGFKLNVCYPVAGRRVRCAIEDFRD